MTKKTRGRQVGMRVPPPEGSWAIIERNFVQGLLQEDGSVYYPTLKELEEAHGVSYATLRRRVYEGKWMQKRETWQQKLHKWVHAATMEDYINAAKKFDATCIEVAQKGMEHILGHIDEAAANGHMLDQVSLDRLGRAAMSYQRVGRLALGLTTENIFTKEQNETTITQVDRSVLSEREQMILDDIAAQIEAKNHQLLAQHVESVQNEDVHQNS